MIPLLAFTAVLQQERLIIDPLLLVEAAEIWSVIGRKDNPVWPGWDARNTPILVYFPNRQDVLVNHPKPPEGFHRYDGPIRSPIGPIFVKNGPTIKEFDGQNTSAVVNGVGTLVVADTLSTRRQWVESVNGRPEAIEDGLFSNPFDTMVIFAHEAFHVYQGKLAPNKAANELDVLKYPALDIQNNVGFALESDFLAEAARASNPQAVRQAGVKWLAARQWRRADLGQSSTAYEDGNEFNEGLAKYVEYRLTECLQAKTPAKEMWLIQGFEGYGNLQAQRGRMIERMRDAMSGKMNVNNDKFGASPARFRLYFSGMGIGALLDKLGAKWHDPILKTNATLTKLVESQLQPTSEELRKAREEILASSRYQELTAAKTKLKEDGEAHIRETLAAFDNAPGELAIDYSQLAKASVGFGFTPFGVLRVTDDQTIFRLLPIRGLVGNLTIGENAARPVYHDQKAKIVRYQLTGKPDETTIRNQVADLMKAEVKTLNLPGVNLENVKGSIQIEGRKITLKLAD